MDTLGTISLQKFRNLMKKRQHRQTLYPKFICLNLKFTFIQNFQIIHPFRELLNSFFEKYMNILDSANLINLTVFKKNSNLNTQLNKGELFKSKALIQKKKKKHLKSNFISPLVFSSAGKVGEWQDHRCVIFIYPCLTRVI